MTSLVNALQQNKISLPQSVIEKFLVYLDLLQRWNKTFNLTAITDPSEMVWHHIMDSLSVNNYLHGQQILDVGTGAGLPGIPLSLINTDKQFTLLDSNGKKTRFLTQVKAELKLSNCEIVQSRCEAYKPIHKFDTIISRAFSSIRNFIENTKHLIARDGVMLAMKGQYPENELRELPKEYEAIIQPIQIKGFGATRHIVLIKK